MAYHPKLPLMSADQNITAQYSQIAVYFGWPKYHGIVQYLQIAVYVGLPKAIYDEAHAGCMSIQLMLATCDFGNAQTS